MKVYGTHDGRTFYMVAARNYKEAAERLRTTVYDLKNFGGIVENMSARALALGRPEVVWKRSLRDGSEWEWED